MKIHLPLSSEVAGSHLELYEYFYSKVNVKDNGIIPAIEAARFLKLSGLSDNVLGMIWDIADIERKGALNKDEFFIALKMVSLHQHNKPVDICNARLFVPPPDMGEVSTEALHAIKNRKSSVRMLGNSVDWSFTSDDKQRYQKVFEKLKPDNGLLAGDKVREVFLNSKLPVDTLGKIWELSDVDMDGCLNRGEFFIAMHLVYKALENIPVPSTLPTPLKTILHNRSNSIIDSSSSLLQNNENYDWVVSAKEKEHFDVMFRATDLDRDGFVSGTEIKRLFLDSGLSQSVLAHIWSLCDIDQVGKLNTEQFALAMHLIEWGTRGSQIPDKLSPNMVPPSYRNKLDLSIPSVNLCNKNVPTYDNPELEAIHVEIQKLNEVEADVKLDISAKQQVLSKKSLDTSTLTRELETLTSTLKQLENQKSAATLKLEDLSTQVSKLEAQVGDQSKLLQVQEHDVSQRRDELNRLSEQERALEKRVREATKKEVRLTKVMDDIELQNNQIHSKRVELEEYSAKLGATLSELVEALAHVQESGTLVSESLLAPLPHLPFLEANYANIRSQLSSPEDETCVSPPLGGATSAEKSELTCGTFNEAPLSHTVTAAADSTWNAGFEPQQDTGDPQAGTWAQFASNDTTHQTAPPQDDSAEDPFSILRPPSRSSIPTTSSFSDVSHRKEPPPRPAPPKHAPARPPPPSFAKKPTETADFADFSHFEQHSSSSLTSCSPSTSFPLSIIDPFSSQDPFRSLHTQEHDLCASDMFTSSTDSGFQSATGADTQLGRWTEPEVVHSDIDTGSQVPQMFDEWKPFSTQPVPSDCHFTTNSSTADAFCTDVDPFTGATSDPWFGCTEMSPDDPWSCKPSSCEASKTDFSSASSVSHGGPIVSSSSIEASNLFGIDCFSSQASSSSNIDSFPVEWPVSK